MDNQEQASFPKKKLQKESFLATCLLSNTCCCVCFSQPYFMENCPIIIMKKGLLGKRPNWPKEIKEEEHKL